MQRRCCRSSSNRRRKTGLARPGIAPRPAQCRRPISSKFVLAARCRLCSMVDISLLRDSGRHCTSGDGIVTALSAARHFLAAGRPRKPTSCTCDAIGETPASRGVDRDQGARPRRRSAYPHGEPPAMPDAAVSTTDLHYLSISDAARLIEQGRLSPVELTQAYLDRIQTFDPQLNAYLLVVADRALAQARAAEADIAAGRYPGPMHGIPFALKDIYDTKGILTSGGSKVGKDNIPAED